jgi:hypothetical protein
MIYYNFLKGLQRNLKSIRVIKDYVSFDLNLPTKWMIPKKYEDIKELNIVKTNEDTISFVTKFDEESIEILENSINEIIKFNIEREEKENLFRNKVQELKGIFDKENINELRTLKFEFNELEDFIKNNEDEQSTEGVSKGTRELQEAESEK